MKRQIKCALTKNEDAQLRLELDNFLDEILEEDDDRIDELLDLWNNAIGFAKNAVINYMSEFDERYRSANLSYLVERGAASPHFSHDDEFFTDDGYYDGLVSFDLLIIGPSPYNKKRLVDKIATNLDSYGNQTVASILNKYI